jgi:type IV pilus assembly protein PilO
MELSLTKLPWYAQIGAFVVLSCAGIGAFFYYYELPQRAEMGGREAQLKTLKADVSKGLETARKLPQFEAQVGDLESRLESLRAVLPEEKDAADLLRQIQTVALQSNLTLKSFKPAPVVSKQLHAEWPIHLELDGSYHNLAIFFDRVARFTRIVNISGVVVKGKERPSPNSTITADCVATTFVLLDKPSPAAKGKGKGKAAAKAEGKAA